jgi:protocatechuate 3,4-dioxygenase beta subunit
MTRHRSADDPDRRLVLRALAALSATGLLWPAGAARALGLLPTPRQSLGPFYPSDIPLDADNDLVRVAGRTGVARGQVTDLVGRVLDEGGGPVSGARVEIWQCDANGRYHHPRDRGEAPLDPDFQGYGTLTTGADGAYRFRTIRPVPYPGRAPHIHFAVTAPGARPLITQMYVRGAPENASDFLLNGIGDPALRESLLVAFEPVSSPDASLAARFDIVLAGGQG